MGRARLGRLLLLLLGFLALAVGAVGIVLPGLPTTPLVLLAVWLFSLSSPRAERWLRAHPRFGPAIDSWQREGALSKRAKITATLFKAAALVLFYLQTRSLIWTLLLAVLLSLVSVYLWTRPAPSQSS